MQTNNRSYAESYGDGRSFLGLGMNQNGANLQYDRLNSGKDFLTSANVSYDGKDFAGALSGTNKSNGWESKGTLSYTKPQGLAASINQGYNFQFGKTNLRPGQVNANITPYAGAMVTANSFKGEDGNFAGQVDQYGQQRGILNAGVNTSANLQLGKKLSLFGNLGLEVAGAGRHNASSAEKQAGAGDIVRNAGYNNTGMTFTPSGNIGLKYRFKQGGTLLYKK